MSPVCVKNSHESIIQHLPFSKFLMVTKMAKRKRQIGVNEGKGGR